MRLVPARHVASVQSYPNPRAPIVLAAFNSMMLSAYLPVLNCRCFDPSEGNVLVEASLGIGIVAVAALIVGVVVVVLIVDRRNLKKALAAAAATASPRRGKSEHLEMIREESQEEEDA